MNIYLLLMRFNAFQKMSREKGYSLLRGVLQYLFPCSTLCSPPYLVRLPTSSVISGIQLAKTAYIGTESPNRAQHHFTQRQHEVEKCHQLFFFLSCFCFLATNSNLYTALILASSDFSCASFYS